MNTKSETEKFAYLVRHSTPKQLQDGLWGAESNSYYNSLDSAAFDIAIEVFNKLWSANTLGSYCLRMAIESYIKIATQKSETE